MSKPVHIIIVLILSMSGIARGQDLVRATNQLTGACASPETNTQAAVPLPPDPENASPEFRMLRAAVQAGNREERESAKGKLLVHVVAGMHKEHVELWMGKGIREIPGGVLGDATNQLVVSYDCRLPDHEGTQLMTIHYEKSGECLVVVGVKGPHFPDE